MISSALLLNVILFASGMAVLLIGGEMLVRGSSRFAKGIGINPMIIGLTIVAFGTSSPEFVVCLVAALKGSSDITLGNIIGSNISNIALILGVSSVISPIRVETSVLRTHVPILIFMSVLFFIICLNGYIGFMEGLLFFSLLIAINIYYLYFVSSKITSSEKSKSPDSPDNKGATPHLFQLFFIVLGLGLLLLGARLTVDQAIIFARTFGFSELVIGITVIAVGTSLPELATTVISSVKKQDGIVVGNIIGSNIFNLGIIGLVTMIHAVEVNPAVIKFDLPVMIALSVLIYPLMYINKVISRFDGLLLLVCYAGFIYFTVK